VLALPSGAGHDAAVMAAVTPVGMLFIRCKGGLSHHPAESASLCDVRAALAVLSDFLQFLATDYE
jgi:allantoate deiminase